MIEKLTIYALVASVTVAVMLAWAWLVRWTLGQFWPTAFDYPVWLWAIAWFIVASLFRLASGGSDK